MSDEADRAAVEARNNPANPEHWDAHYRAHEPGWDIGQPAPAFVDLLAEPDPPPPGRMIVPGSGRGHDAIFFAAHGFDVVGIDFAPTAVAEATAAASQRDLTGRVRFEERNIFALPAGVPRVVRLRAGAYLLLGAQSAA